jgi:phage tail tape-measure protein
MTGGAVGPLGAILGAGVGAAVGSYLGKKGGSAVFDRYFTP